MWGSAVLGGAIVAIACWAVALTIYDEKQRRLPDSLTLPAAVGAGTGAILVEPWLLLGGLAWAGLYLLIGLVAGGIGGGDIKLALSLGIVAGTGGPVLWFATVLGASMMTIVRGLLSRSGTVAHGPSMLGATVAAVALA
ncbi:prepilin peptidase [Corynebacterium alimapuense]|uniref:Prepilin peptidase n=1 Tax=Corynebacterium alimapuense TaxID=1576874 RepID=A0A3M8K9M8_9CORY|nr:prepilin peptidase [Corynebacterium alimapuense]RNE49242.1 prepilin peptidase [Corynebacterium alimapuense]